MSQCRGTTKRGERCRNEAVGGSNFCSIHAQTDAGEGGARWDDDFSDTAKTVLGLAIAAVIVFSYLLRGR